MFDIDPAIPLSVIVALLIYKDIKNTSEINKLKLGLSSRRKDNTGKIYTSIVNVTSYIFDIMLAKELIVPPKDYAGSKRKLIFGSVISVLPEAKKYVAFVPSDDDEIVTGRNHIMKDGEEIQ